MYRPQADDTSEKVDRMLIDAYRRMPTWEKFERIRSLSQGAYEFAAAGIRLRKPEASDREIQVLLAIRRFGAEIVQRALESPAAHPRQ